MFNATQDEQRRCSEDINRYLGEGKLKPRIDRVRAEAKQPPPTNYSRKTRWKSGERSRAKSC